MQKYLARYGKVWKHIKTGRVCGNEIELKEGERILEYKQIPEPKKTAPKQVVSSDKKPFGANEKEGI